MKCLPIKLVEDDPFLILCDINRSEYIKYDPNFLIDIFKISDRDIKGNKQKRTLTKIYPYLVTIFKNLAVPLEKSLLTVSIPLNSI